MENETDLKLIAYPIGAGADKNMFKPAKNLQQWQLDTHNGTATHCLPLNIANGHGWEGHCPGGFDAIWNGLNGLDSLEIIGHGDGPVIAQSHFGYGVLTFSIGVLMRTPPSHNIMVMGPINQPKDMIQGLSGIIETDWAPYSFTMNWKFTRPGRVRFNKGEAFCHFFPTPRGYVESFTTEFRNFKNGEKEGFEDFISWSKSRNTFNQELHEGKEETVKQGWQKLYYRGLYPDGKRSKKDHQIKLKCSNFVDNSGFDFENASNIWKKKSHPITACLVTHNDNLSISKFLDIMAPKVDELLILDLGSQDGTPEIINNSPYVNVKLFLNKKHNNKPLEFLAKKATNETLLFLNAEDRVLEEFWEQVPNYINDLKNKGDIIQNPVHIGLVDKDPTINELINAIEESPKSFIDTEIKRTLFANKRNVINGNYNNPTKPLDAFTVIYSIFPDGHKNRDPEYLLKKMLAENKKGIPIDENIYNTLAQNFTYEYMEGILKEAEDTNDPFFYDSWWGDKSKK